MSVLDSFFNRGFKAAKCKTLLKLTMPRIKLLRNRREIQIKQMRKDIAKLLETGQEATARIRVEHIIREENMMAAQEILELYCEYISVRLPIIEAQRECPLDLKAAISSICFAAPRCADLPELLQVQILFASKYGKEFVSAATELLPDCGVNRQLIELLSIRAPSPEKKLKLLKEIAEEHELDWDPAATETEFSKIHEDLLNGPTQFGSGSKLPLPKEKHDEALNTVADNVHNEQSDSDADLDTLDFPEVPKVSLRPNANTVPAPKIDPTEMLAIHPDITHELSKQSVTSKNIPEEPHFEHGEVPRSELTEEKFVATKNEIPTAIIDKKEENQFLPFVSPPSLSSPSFSPKPSGSPPPISRAKSDVNVDLQDVLAAAQVAAETAERAAAAARSAATLAQARISELTKKTGESFPENSNENPFHADTTDQSAATEQPHFDHQQSFDHSVAFGKPTFDHQQSFGDYSGVPGNQDSSPTNENHQPAGLQDLPSFDKLKVAYDSPRHDHSLQPDSTRIQPQRLPSIDDDSYLAYPNLFSPHGVNHGSGSQSGKDSSPSSHGF